MITLDRSFGGPQRTYVIYEPGDIIPEGIRVVRYRNRFSAMKGEYVEDINGRIVPCLRRQTVSKKRDFILIFPGFTWMPHNQPIFSYPLERASQPPETRLSWKHRQMARYMEMGLSPELCVTKVYGRRGNAAIVILRRLFDNPAFLHYLATQTSYMSTLRRELEKRNIGVDTVADQISDILNDPKPNTLLKKWALETIVGAYDNPKKALPQLPEERAEAVEASDDPDAIIEQRFLAAKARVTDTADDSLDDQADTQS